MYNKAKLGIKLNFYIKKTDRNVNSGIPMNIQGISHINLFSKNVMEYFNIQL